MILFLRNSKIEKWDMPFNEQLSKFKQLKN